MRGLKGFVILLAILAATGFALVDTVFRQEMGFAMRVDPGALSAMGAGIGAALRSGGGELLDLSREAVDRIRLATGG